MSKIWPKVIRDPIHNIVPFQDTPSDKLLLDLINTKEFQRLRRIKQLGMSELVFPGANHSRFAHAIGVMHTARKFLDRIEQLKPKSLTEDQQTAVLVAALIHDLGHGPFSHAFEKVTGEDHEARTLEIILDDSTEIHQRLITHNPDLPKHLESFFNEDWEEGESDQEKIPAYLSQIVSSQLDADRFDYLLRDSHATGTEYGRFDPNWLIQHLYVDDKKKRFYLGRKALHVVEGYIFARYHMYQMVYFHKTSRAAEKMLQLLFQRYKELLRDASGDIQKSAIVPDAPRRVIDAFANARISLEEYLLLDDHTITEFLKSCEASQDEILSSLGRGLVHRQLFKATDTMDSAMVDVGEFTKQVSRKIAELQLHPDYWFVNDTAADTPYKPYDPDDDKPATQIYVETTTDKIREISTISEPIAQLRRKLTLLRYYYPEKIRGEIKRIEQATLRREKG